VIVEEYNIMWKLIELFYVLRTITVLHDSFSKFLLINIVLEFVYLLYFDIHLVIYK